MRIDRIRTPLDVLKWVGDQLLHGLYVAFAVYPVLLWPTWYGVALSGFVVLAVREIEQARRSSTGWAGLFDELTEIDRTIDVVAGILLALALVVPWL